MRLMGQHLWRCVVLLSALGLVVAACSPGGDTDVAEAPEVDDGGAEPVEPAAPDDDPGAGGAIVWALEQEPGVLNPTIADGNLYATAQIALTTLLPLWVITPDFEYVPSALLESATPAEDGAEQFSVTYTLNPEATWSDGEPIRARDVLFTLEVCLDPDADITSRAGCDEVDMERTATELDPDGNEIVVYFHDTYAPWRTLFSTADLVLLPSHVFGEESPGEDWNTTWADGIVHPETGEPIASGPFMFESWDHGLQLEVVRNDRYAGEPAQLDRVVFRFIPDTDTMVQQLRGREIDLIDPQPQIDLVEQIEAIDGVTIQREVGENFELLQFQHDHPLLGERWMREAIARAIDRDAFVEQVILPIDPNAAPLNSLVFVSNHPAYEDHLGAHVDHDPERSRALLEEHCTPGDDGIYECDGRQASFAWTTTAGNERRELFFEYAQEQLRGVGIEVTADFDEPAVAFGAFFEGDFEIFNLAFVGEPDPDANVEVFGCFAGAEDRTAPGAEPGFQNYHGFCPDDEVTQTLIDTSRELDPDARNAGMNAAGAALAADIPVLPLYQLPFILAHSDAFTGPQLNPTQWGSSWNITEWRPTG
jgi:peptide/nickel transport system substrate-binding protein